MTKQVVVFLAALTLDSGGALTAQQQSATAPGRQSYTSSTTAILVDVVVRDRKGRPVTDLVVDDFGVYEDGVAQRIDTFTRVVRGGGIGVGVRWKSPATTVLVAPGAGAALPPALDEATDETTTALVFDHLSEDALHLAQRATLHYVPMNGESDVHVGVFSTAQRMKLLQQYTTDRAAIRLAVERVLPSGTSASELKADRRDQIMERRGDLQGEVQALTAATTTGAGASLAQNGSQMGQVESELRLLELERSLIDSFDSLDREHKGYDTALSLMGVIQTLSYRPGRKTVVFFSEGLPVSPVLSARLDDVIDAANRSNVTVYAVDAQGLRAKSTLTDTRKEMQSFANDRLMQVMSGSSRTDQPLTRGLEKVEDMVRLDSRTGLARLSADTGGFLVEQSNDLTSAFQRIDEDNQFHYLLSYTPANAVFDGKFRTIQVKTRRSGYQVFSRKGYRAVRAPSAFETASYERPALAMLDQAPPPNAFPMQAQGFSFPDPSHPGVTPILVRLSTDALRYSIDNARATYSAQVAVVVRVKDGQGREVEKLSQQYSLSGDVKDLDAAKNGTILFYREPRLPAGIYTIESLALDMVAEHASARISTLTVATAEPTVLGMSSLVLVDHLELVASAPTAPGDRAAPFYVKQTLVYPNLGDPVARSATNELLFYFTVYRGSAEPLRATAELMRNGQVIAEAPVDLPPSDGSRLQAIGRLPLGALAPGTYELRIRVAASSQEVVRSNFFTLRS